MYRVTKQYGRGVETLCNTFKSLVETKSFVETSLATDLTMGVKAIYRIYEGVDLVEELNPENTNLKTSQSSGSQGEVSSSSFRPTPFNTAPHPSGTPQKWVKDDNEEKK